MTIRQFSNARVLANSDLGYAGEIDAQPCAQPDGPARGFYLANVAAARRLARTLGLTKHAFGAPPAMKLDDLRAFALALPDVTEEPHHNYSSFRVQGKIFVTIPPDELHVHVFPSEDDRERFLAMYPEAFEKLYWGSKAVGVRIHLPSATPGAVKSVVGSAHNYKTPRPKRRASVPAVAATRRSSKVKRKSPP